MNYAEFIAAKAHSGNEFGFAPDSLPEFLFDFQRDLVTWALRKGRAAIFGDCGLGKTPMQLVWADQVARKTGKPVLILTPLAVAFQTVLEAQKFGIKAARSIAGEISAPIVILNYERLQYVRPEHFGGVVCDESTPLSFCGLSRHSASRSNAEHIMIQPQSVQCSTAICR